MSAKLVLVIVESFMVMMSGLLDLMGGGEVCTIITN